MLCDTGLDYRSPKCSLGDSVPRDMKKALEYGVDMTFAVNPASVDGSVLHGECVESPEGGAASTSDGCSSCYSRVGYRSTGFRPMGLPAV